MQDLLDDYPWVTNQKISKLAWGLIDIFGYDSSNFTWGLLLARKNIKNFIIKRAKERKLVFCPERVQITRGLKPFIKKLKDKKILLRLNKAYNIFKREFPGDKIWTITPKKIFERQVNKFFAIKDITTSEDHFFNQEYLIYFLKKK